MSKLCEKFYCRYKSPGMGVPAIWVKQDGPGAGNLRRVQIDKGLMKRCCRSYRGGSPCGTMEPNAKPESMNDL